MRFRVFFPVVGNQPRRHGVAPGKQRSASTHSAAAAGRCGRNPRQTLNVRATGTSSCLREHRESRGADGSEQRFRAVRLPKDTRARVALAQTIGADGHRLLECSSAETGLPWLAEREAMHTAATDLASVRPCVRTTNGLPQPCTLWLPMRSQPAPSAATRCSGKPYHRGLY
jgi:hypothetical protein